MKNTRIEATIPSREYHKLTEQWRSEGYVVWHKYVVGHDIDEDYAIASLTKEIKEENPEHEPLETVTETHGINIYVAAKCKVKEEKK